MRIEKETIRQIRWLIIFTAGVVMAGIHYTRVLDFANWIFGICTPFLVGAGIAFILNVPMRTIEKHLPFQKKKRIVSLLLAMLFFIMVVFVVFRVIVPQLGETLAELQRRIPAFFVRMQEQLSMLFTAYPEISDWIEGIQIDWKGFFASTIAIVSSSAGGLVSSIFSTITTAIISTIFAIYILLQKETLGRQFCKLFRAYLPYEKANSLISLLRFTEKTFSKFLTGQCLEALILGGMFVITLMVFHIPYAVLIGTLVAFTALIPMVGAFIGCFVGAFLILTVAPIKAVYFVIIFLILQQIEGNLIYPHVVGSSIGLPSVWVLVAVTVGGGTFGVLGMLVGIPLFSVLYALVRNAANSRLSKKAAEEKTETLSS